MASILVDFKNGSNGRADVLQISFQFEEDELNRTYLVKIGCRINGPGTSVQGPWQDLSEKIITSEKTSMMTEWEPSISPTSSFQQRVQFKVVLFGPIFSHESREWMLHR